MADDVAEVMSHQKSSEKKVHTAVRQIADEYAALSSHQMASDQRLDSAIRAIEALRLEVVALAVGRLPPADDPTSGLVAPPPPAMMGTMRWRVRDVLAMPRSAEWKVTQPVSPWRCKRVNLIEGTLEMGNRDQVQCELQQQPQQSQIFAASLHPRSTNPGRTSLAGLTEDFSQLRAQYTHIVEGPTWQIAQWGWSGNARARM
ncbi:hypothetical protein M404DRAFT_18549 [Pisolithus tinctorius Marx 270]|uniref:Uncharacterized protein n=1 Tax=Pisolithus tinctorius Marx 270 TaxID=870435 RepID=A0A0C3JZ15_PISTI|nr:hypothetical protein M404DRAFT_18549 [Pisolithus tinctorius Marx 270]